MMAVAMWLWVQDIAIPRQQSDAATNGSPRGNLSDLFPRWLGARELLLRGRDPYSTEVTREIQIGYYGRPIDPARPHDPKDQQAFAYPLYVVFVLGPTVGLPFSIVQQAFLWLLFLLSGASVLLWFRALGWNVSLTTRALWVVLVMGSFPAIQGLKLQQLTLLVAALLAMSMNAIVGRNFVWAGTLLAFATIKPQLVFLPVVWLSIWVIGDWRRRQRLFWSFTVSMAILVGASEFLLPGWIHEFRTASAAYYRYTGGGKSVLDVALTPVWGRSVSAVLVAGVLILIWQVRHSGETSHDFHWSLALVLATTLVVIPMFAPYNQLLLVPALMVIVRAGPSLWKSHRISRLLIGVTAFSVLWPWLAAALLVIALLFLPSPVVQRAWALPVYTSLTIPVTILALQFVGRRSLRVETPK
jgi:hypothetical protein